MNKTFHHVGVPTSRSRAGEIYLPDIRLYITDAGQHPHRIEWVRFGEGCTLPAILSQRAHVAFAVDQLEAALVGQQVIVPPFEPLPGVRVAFVLDDEAPVEFLEFRK